MHEDAALLRCYAETRSEAAFTALVQRHLPLVYSAALRQVGGDAHRAQEVAQTVFTLLARKAGAMHRHPALTGWLYTTTHHTAAKLRRTEQRRWRREQEAQAMHDRDENPTASVDWERLRPVIDESMLQLKEDDRTAVLLRYFENRPHAEIGAQLGLSENAARMRVDRALEALRAALARRGIGSAAAALGAALSSQALMTPPAGLAAAISTGAAATAIGGSLAILMNSTVLKTGLLTAVIGAGTAGLVWQHRENVRLHNEVNQLRAQADRAERRAAQPATPAQAATPERNLDAELARLRAEITALKSSPANSWQERVSQLRQLLERVPELGIPEIQLATDEDWLDAAKPELETEDDYRRALARIRTMAIMRFTALVRPALAQYLKRSAGQFPADVSLLQPFMERSVDRAIWPRYVIQPATTIPNIKMGGDWIITQRGPVDEVYDAKFAVGPYGSGMTTYASLNTQTILAPVMKAFSLANPGQAPSHPAQLLPYATTTEQRQAVEKTIGGPARK